MYKIRVYRAPDEEDTCKTYIEGHAKVLQDYGVTMITSYKPTWQHNPQVYCIIATDEKNEMVGGIRLHIADEIVPLPMEDAITKLDRGIHDLVKKYMKNGVGELCGLWNSKRVAGVGLSFVLTRAAISVINQLKFSTLMGICAEYSLQMFLDVGFKIDASLAKNGEFPYPTEEYITRVVGILNTDSLATAKEYDKERMLGLRKAPIQIREETGKKGNFLVSYDLTVYNKP
ncbi:MAG: hypothetical protein ACK4K0_02055 [Flavobacteriales bacterium]